MPPNEYLTSAALPYGTYGSIGANQIGALNTLGQFGQSASNLPQTQIQDYLGYLGQGTQQQSANNQTAQMQAMIQQMYGKSIGQGLSALGGGGYSLFGGPQMTGGTAFTGPQNTGYGGMGGWTSSVMVGLGGNWQD